MKTEEDGTSAQKVGRTGQNWLRRESCYRRLGGAWLWV